MLLFLTIDHINGRAGEAIRGRGRLSGTQLYRALRNQGFPDDVRLLCFNCNSGRERNGGVCPHEAT